MRRPPSATWLRNEVERRSPHPRRRRGRRGALRRPDQARRADPHRRRAQAARRHGVADRGRLAAVCGAADGRAGV